MRGESEPTPARQKRGFWCSVGRECRAVREKLGRDRGGLNILKMDPGRMLSPLLLIYNGHEFRQTDSVRERRRERESKRRSVYATPSPAAAITGPTLPLLFPLGSVSSGTVYVTSPPLSRPLANASNTIARLYVSGSARSKAC